MTYLQYFLIISLFPANYYPDEDYENGPTFDEDNAPVFEDAGFDETFDCMSYGIAHKPLGCSAEIVKELRGKILNLSKLGQKSTWHHHVSA